MTRMSRTVGLVLLGGAALSACCCLVPRRQPPQRYDADGNPLPPAQTGSGYRRVGGFLVPWYVGGSGYGTPYRTGSTYRPGPAYRPGGAPAPSPGVSRGGFGGTGRAVGGAAA